MRAPFAQFTRPARAVNGARNLEDGDVAFPDGHVSIFHQQPGQTAMPRGCSKILCPRMLGENVGAKASDLPLKEKPAQRESLLRSTPRTESRKTAWFENTVHRQHRTLSQMLPRLRGLGRLPTHVSGSPPMVFADNRAIVCLELSSIFGVVRGREKKPPALHPHPSLKSL